MALAIILFFFVGYGAGDLLSKKPQFNLASYLFMVVGMVFGMGMTINGFNNFNPHIDLAANDDFSTAMICIPVFVVAFILGNKFGNDRAKEDINNNNSRQPK